MEGGEAGEGFGGGLGGEGEVVVGDQVDAVELAVDASDLAVWVVSMAS